MRTRRHGHGREGRVGKIRRVGARVDVGRRAVPISFAVLDIDVVGASASASPCGLELGAHLDEVLGLASMSALEDMGTYPTARG